jgi:pimeloyl-ACP methyl ester carboxylesterase
VQSNRSPQWWLLVREGVIGMAIIRVNGAALYYEEHGTGPQTIVLAHGLLWSCRMFDAQVTLLKERYRCVAFDFRGQGQSEVTRGGYDMETLYGMRSRSSGNSAAPPVTFWVFPWGALSACVSPPGALSCCDR